MPGTREAGLETADLLDQFIDIWCNIELKYKRRDIWLYKYKMRNLLV